MVDPTSGDRIAHTRRAALDRTQIRQLATRSATIAVADANLDASPTALPQIVDAVLHAAERWMTLQGVLLAADHLDNLIADTQRHLVEPAADRAENNPYYREILSMHRQYVDGMREARTRLGSTAAHMLSQATEISEHAAEPMDQPAGHADYASTSGPASVDHAPAR